MSNTYNDNALGIEGVIDTAVHDVTTLQEAYPAWDTFSKDDKLRATRNVTPVYTDRSYNVTTAALHEYFVDNLDPDNTSPEADVSVSYMAIGDDGSSGTTVNDTDLNNRLYDEPITDVADAGDSLLASTFIDSTEANQGGSVDYDEIGLFTGDPANAPSDDAVFLVNHSSFTPITKDNTKTVTFDVTLTFSDV
jgi:hypothetical protein